MNAKITPFSTSLIIVKEQQYRRPTLFFLLMADQHVKTQVLFGIAFDFSSALTLNKQTNMDTVASISFSHSLTHSLKNKFNYCSRFHLNAIGLDTK
jgi:hypothetical protein